MGPMDPRFTLRTRAPTFTTRGKDPPTAARLRPAGRNPGPPELGKGRPGARPGQQALPRAGKAVPAR